MDALLGTLSEVWLGIGRWRVYVVSVSCRCYEMLDPV
jgi:hypothetical protein